MRVKALDELLTKREFAQILYSFATRRGYIPHGEGSVSSLENTGDSENGKVLKAIAENSKAFNSSQYRTIGEFLYTQERSRNKNGNYEKCILHQQLIDEVQAIFKGQRNLGNAQASEALEKAYLEIFNWEKDKSSYDKTVYEQVGSCSYFKNEKRAALASLSFEMCRAYEALGKMTIVESGRPDKHLTGAEIQKYINLLFSPSKEYKLTYNKIRKDLGISDLASFKGVNADKEKTEEVTTPKAFNKIRKTLKDEYFELLEKMRNDIDFADSILEALTYASTETSLKDRLYKLIDNITDEEIEIIKTIPFTSKLFKGYGARSKKALSLLLDAFEDENIRTLWDAEDATGLGKMRLNKDAHERTKLLPQYSDYNKIMKNPVVLRSITRARKIVNSIIKIYGVPHEIHVELARDLKHSQKEKKAYSDGIKANKTANKDAAAYAAQHLNISEEDVSEKLLQKIRLYNEQGCKDIYTGESLDIDRVIENDFYTEIDHILPFSRTGIDGMKNKVLTLASNNQNKKARTPYEWMTSGELSAPDWDKFRARVLNCKNIAENKKRNLLRETLTIEDSQKFIERNLNDTRYMSREFKNYLENSLDFPEIDGKKQHVFVVNGQTTHMLRHVWGLNFGEDGVKDRSDDRHHAVDAAVIAACNTSAIQAVVKHHFNNEEGKRQTEEKLAAGAPWEAFAHDVKEFREKITPTRMANHSVTGTVLEDFHNKLHYINEKSILLFHIRKMEHQAKKHQLAMYTSTQMKRQFKNLVELHLCNYGMIKRKKKVRVHGMPTLYIISIYQQFNVAHTNH